MTQKTQIQHVMNFYLQKHSQKQSSTSYTLQPEDVDIFLPFQDHIQCIPRPSHIPVPTIWLLKPQITKHKPNKETPSIQQTRPSCIQVYKDKKCTQIMKDSHLNPIKIYNLQTVLQHQVTKLPRNGQLYLHNRQLQPSQKPSSQGKHLFCQCHLHQPD